MPAPLTEGALGEKRITILEAARAVCRETGLDAVKMADIAARARVSKGTLYRFFSSKEDLLTDMVLVQQERSLEELDNIAGQSCGAHEQLAHVIRSLTDGLTAENVALNLQALSVAQRNPRAAEKVSARLLDLYGQQQRAIELIIRRGIDRQELRALDVSATAAALMSFCDGFSYRASFDPRFREPDVIARVFEQVVEMGALKGQTMA